MSAKIVAAAMREGKWIRVITEGGTPFDYSPFELDEQFGRGLILTNTNFVLIDPYQVIKRDRDDIRRLRLKLNLFKARVRQWEEKVK